MSEAILERFGILASGFQFPFRMLPFICRQGRGKQRAELGKTACRVGENSVQSWTGGCDEWLPSESCYMATKQADFPVNSSI